MAETTAPTLDVQHLTKSFGPVRALEDVSLQVDSGQVLGLIGDNGAGKSTLVKCLSGVLTPDGGQVRIDGQEADISSPQAARDLGIETVFQDLALVETLDVATNLFLNRETVRRGAPLRWVGWIDKRRMYAEAEAILERLHIRIPSVRQEVSRLSGGQRQAIAIGRAVGWGRKVVLLDEPAAALGVEQSQHVLELMETLSSQGVAVLLISHNMQHVIESCHRAVVLRHGRKVADILTADVTARGLVDLITGARDAA